jgi:hypothetical protein
MGETIEDIILEQDKRGVAQLRPYMDDDFCAQAAQYIMDHPGNVAIVTGFYILAAGKPETDGPAGAVAIGNALQALGRKVTYISDDCSMPILRGILGDDVEIIEFPVADVETSKKVSAEILEKLDLSLIISIERCSRTKDNAYLNMRYMDITPHTARLDYLFEAGIPSVGIGDGGNEIGMGNLALVIPTVERLPQSPAITQVGRLVIASVSNWGGYGLVAALSRLVGRNLLPTVDHETDLIQRLVDNGVVVDGTTGEAVYTVDNFSTEENGKVLQQLHRLVEKG